MQGTLMDYNFPFFSGISEDDRIISNNDFTS